MGAGATWTSASKGFPPVLPALSASDIRVCACVYSCNAFMCVHVRDTSLFGVCALHMGVYEACLCTCSSACGWLFPQGWTEEGHCA